LDAWCSRATAGAVAAEVRLTTAQGNSSSEPPFRPRRARRQFRRSCLWHRRRRHGADRRLQRRLPPIAAWVRARRPEGLLPPIWCRRPKVRSPCGHASGPGQERSLKHLLQTGR